MDPLHDVAFFSKTRRVSWASHRAAAKACISSAIAPELRIEPRVEPRMISPSLVSPSVLMLAGEAHAFSTVGLTVAW